MTIRFIHSIQDISADAWERLTVPGFPFMSYHFLRSLETTDCLGRRTGWSPVYLTAWDGERLAGALVVFVKTNSYGEYIFDFGWAQAAEALGLSYYPKLVLAAPFTPATGPKILRSRELSAEQDEEVARELLAELSRLRKMTETSSTHALFIPETEIAAFQAAGYFTRHSFQYHWRNNDYADFEAFLATLKGKRRREINRERAQVRASEVQIERLSGAGLNQAHADLFYQFYADTVAKRAGYEYLTPAFFREVFRTMPDQVLLVLARSSAGEPLAGALYYFGGQTLFGRHWGCHEDHRALHFELCYYQGIEFAIEKKLTLFEAGAQGEHKFQRGFLPHLTYSAHRIENPKLSALVEEFVAREKRELVHVFDDYREHSPFAISP